MDNKGKSTHRHGGPREYRSLLEDRFDNVKLVRIERSGDPDDISNKWCDSSKKTIDGLIEQGMKDALNTLVDNTRRTEIGGVGEAINHINKFITAVKDRIMVHNQTMIEIAEAIKIKLPVGDNIV